MEKNPHGGKREGAGRKTDRPKKTVSMTLPLDIIAWLDEVGGEGNRSATATLVLDGFMQAEKKANT